MGRQVGEGRAVCAEEVVVVVMMLMVRSASRSRRELSAGESMLTCT